MLNKERLRNDPHVRVFERDLLRILRYCDRHIDMQYVEVIAITSINTLSIPYT
jgi:hypothetical protein